MADTINPNWSRWFFASLTSFFNDNIIGLPFYVEGQTRDSKVSDFVEFRMDGPYFNELNVKYWTVDVLVSLIIQNVQDDVDIHKLERNIGLCAFAFKTDIPIYRYGDDDSLLCCIKLSTQPNDKIRIDKFGQTQAAVPINQASIEARYNTTLDTR
jgi:hypothetical protein